MYYRLFHSYICMTPIKFLAMSISNNLPGRWKTEKQNILLFKVYFYYHFHSNGDAEYWMKFRNRLYQIPWSLLNLKYKGEWEKSLKADHIVMEIKSFSTFPTKLLYFSQSRHPHSKKLPF